MTPELAHSLNNSIGTVVFEGMWKRSGILVAILVTVAAALLPATGTETRAFAPGGTVKLSLPVGTVTVHPTQQNRILLQYVVHPDHDGPPAPSDSMTLDFQTRQDTAEIRFNDPEKTGKHEPTVNVVLEVPAHTNLDLHVGVGKLTLASGWQGDLQLRVGVGDIVVRGATRQRMKSLDAATGLGGIHSTVWGDGHGFMARTLQSQGTGLDHVFVRIGVGSLSLEP